MSANAGEKNPMGVGRTVPSHNLPRVMASTATPLLNTVHFVCAVPGKPAPQLRHRHRKDGKGVYDPSGSAKNEMRMKLGDEMHLKNISPAPVLTPVEAKLAFHFGRPKSHLTNAGKLRPSAPLAHTGAPDVDNLIKFALDSMQGMYTPFRAQIPPTPLPPLQSHEHQRGGAHGCDRYMTGRGVLGVPGVPGVAPHAALTSWRGDLAL